MEILTEDAVAKRLATAFPANNYRNRRILLIVPDNTRTAPVGFIFKSLYGLIGPLPGLSTY